MGTAEPVFLLDRKGPFRIALAGWLDDRHRILVHCRFDGPARTSDSGRALARRTWIAAPSIHRLPVWPGPGIRRPSRRPQEPADLVSRCVCPLPGDPVHLDLCGVDVIVGGCRCRAPRQKMSRMAESYFYTYMVVQFIMVCFLTPAAVAGAIADEKERRTLEFLLATDLRDREILFGKLATRVGSLLLFLLAGLPILGMLQFFGGIDPELVIAGFAATFMVVLSLAAVGIAASVMSRQARDAIALTYLVGIAYIVLSFVIYGVSVIPTMRFDFELFGYTITSEDLSYPFVCGNPLFMVVYVMERRAFGGNIDLFDAARSFHAVPCDRHGTLARVGRVESPADRAATDVWQSIAIVFSSPGFAATAQRTTRKIDRPRGFDKRPAAGHWRFADSVERSVRRRGAQTWRVRESGGYAPGGDVVRADCLRLLVFDRRPGFTPGLRLLVVGVEVGPFWAGDEHLPAVRRHRRRESGVSRHRHSRSRDHLRRARSAHARRTAHDAAVGTHDRLGQMVGLFARHALGVGLAVWPVGRGVGQPGAFTRSCFWARLLAWPSTRAAMPGSASSVRCTCAPRCGRRWRPSC